MKRILLVLTAVLGLSAPAAAQWATNVSFGFSCPTRQQTGLQIPNLHLPSGDRPVVGIKSEMGLELNLDLQRKVSESDSLYLDLLLGVNFCPQRQDVDSFSMTSSFVPPSLNVMSYLYLPAMIGAKWYWFTRDGMFGGGLSAGIGVAYRNIHYSILEDLPDDDLNFRDRGFSPCMQVGAECVVGQMMTFGLFVRKIGNGSKNATYYTPANGDEGTSIWLDHSQFRYSAVIFQCGFRF